MLIACTHDGFWHLKVLLCKADPSGWREDEWPTYNCESATSALVLVVAMGNKLHVSLDAQKFH